MENTTEKISKKNFSFSSRRKGRELAIQAFYQYELGTKDLAYLESLLWASEEKKPDPNLMDYYTKIFRQTIENIDNIDGMIKEFATKYDFSKIMPIDKAILRYGIGALLYEQDLPSQIIINEAIEIAKRFSGVGAHKFINGVLDGVCKKLISQCQRITGQ